MIKFLFKGILRDKSRSLLPIIIIASGVMLTVMLSGYMNGAFGDMIDQNARFDTGHMKVMTRAYAENKDQIPNDLAILEVGALREKLSQQFPEVTWVNRIKFGGLIDVPDKEGNTKTQGPAIGFAWDLLSKNTTELKRMNLEACLVKGNLPKQPGEALISQDFAQKLGLNLGEEFTYFGTTMEGSMTFKNFKIAGTILFGTPAMDKSAIIVDVADAQRMLDMEDGAGEILGFLNGGIYDHKEASAISNSFNKSYEEDKDEYAPLMMPLKAQNNLAGILDYGDSMTSVFIFLFIIAMSIVLWNTGLLGGLRRYKEFGIRLALGEAKSNIYKTLVMEAVLIGIIGSIVGTIIGLAITWYMQVYGFDISSYMENNSMLMPAIIRSKITPSLFFIGFIPGVLAMVFGNMLAGIGIYKRETANLFKELEV